ncbi:nuclear transport factor 2 family protein [Aureisphaera galaxeae]|uniref:nuclear transport factor 2 family protein n=1 Tax=Aureisphaera galaxeae TaxID=1538023 RepID=UPI00235044C3|nr:nuclear transport factor 2 family protein [Aureisphaera galaxeae]MDC8005250.1 nuclear transport factor 2 family protein [Aureisphaera galaxeae]
MTTQEIANQLVAFCREGKYEEAYGLYAEDAVHVEMPGMPGDQITTGLNNIIEGYKNWASSISEVHSSSVGEPTIMGDHFCVPMSSDATFEGTGRWDMKELCVYQVRDGKIAKASFFYDLPGA